MLEAIGIGILILIFAIPIVAAILGLAIVLLGVVGVPLATFIRFIRG